MVDELCQAQFGRCDSSVPKVSPTCTDINQLKVDILCLRVEGRGDPLTSFRSLSGDVDESKGHWWGSLHHISTQVLKPMYGCNIICLCMKCCQRQQFSGSEDSRISTLELHIPRQQSNNRKNYRKCQLH